MLKYLPKDTMAQWAVGSIAVVGAAGLAYVLIFPSENEPPELPQPAALMVEPDGAEPPDFTTQAPELQIAQAAPLSTFSPSFDVVRVTDIGDVLIAGKAPATSAVSALIDEVPVAQTISTAAGEFVMMFEIDTSPAPRLLELEVRLAGGERVRSVDTLMLAPRSPETPMDPDAPAQIARVVEVEPLFPHLAAPPRPSLMEAPAGADTPMTPSPPGVAAAADATEETPEVAPPDQPVARDGPINEPQPPVALLVRRDGGVQMLGPAPGFTGSAAQDNVSIDSVVYDAEGEVAISGRTRGAASDIQIYLDNQPILRARASPEGNWQAQLAGIERGVYRLRVDEFDEDAQVISRAEIPFERATPEFARETSGPQALIVQPGNTLWGMSEQQFGDGMRYMRIFDANRDQIRNPDLIYPGQVFLLPKD